MERLCGLGNRRRIGLATLEHDGFDDVFEQKYRAGRIPMREVPDRTFVRGWTQAALKAAQTVPF